jgi:spermidine synthase
MNSREHDGSSSDRTSWSGNKRTEPVREKFEETGSWNEGHWFAVGETLYQGETDFQSVQIVRSLDYGVLVVLDGHTQSAELDEYIYHEALVHPGLIACRNPKSVLVIGGGEGATLREVLRHPGIERVVMVDIDGKFVDLCRNMLPQWHRGAFDDPRVELVISDGKAYIEQTSETFDVLILDVVDAFDEGPATLLYSRAFYRAAKSRLHPDGMLIIQAMELAVGQSRDHGRVLNEIKPLFRHVRSYSCFIPSFWCEWGYIVASDSGNPGALRADEVDGVLAKRELAGVLRFYDGETHHRMFALPLDVRAELARNQ